MADSWREVLAAQEGVISRAQALGGGLTRQAWEWRVGRSWQRLLPGVAVAHTGRPTDRERAWAAVLHGGRGAALSGDAALVVHGMRLAAPSVLDLAVPGGRRVVSTPFEGGMGTAVVRRVRGLEDWTTTRGDLALTRPAVSVLHAASWAQSDRAAEWRVAAAVQQRTTAVRQLRTTLAGMPVLPRRGLVAAVLDDVELGAHAGSELLFLRFCRTWGLPCPDELQRRVRVGAVLYLDARYRRQRVTVELDGAHHRDVGQWEADALRTLRIVAAMPGERVVRLTTGMLRHDAAEVARWLRVLLCGAP